jgi:hypothetical protein
MDFHSRAGRHRNPPIAIQARLSDVERVLKRR